MVFVRILLAALLAVVPVSTGMAKPAFAVAKADVAQTESESGLIGEKGVSITPANAGFAAKLPLKRCPGRIFGYTLCTSYIVVPVQSVSVTTAIETRLSGPRSDDVPSCSDRGGIFHPPRS